MARTPALSTGPLGFTDISTGKQLQLPLNAVYFEDKKVKAEGPVYNSNKTAADAWLAHLVQSGRILPDPNPPSKPAMKIAAKAPGANGSQITVKVENLQPDLATPANTKFDVTVSETDTYKGLKPATIQDILGNAAGKGTQPGLVFVPGASAPTELPKAGDYSLAGTPAVAAIPKNSGSGDAFTVQARADGADAAATKVTIADLNEAAGTFTLSANWSKKAAAIKAADVAATFAYELAVSAPDGAPLAAPAAGTFALGGGADAVNNPAVTASAVLAAGQ